MNKVNKFQKTILSLLLLGFSNLFAANNTSATTMPLKAFGLENNYNLTLIPQNRLNPTQVPQTNNMQLYQQKFPTGFGYSATFSEETLTQGSYRIGPCLGSVAATGPGIVYPVNYTANFTLPAGSVAAYLTTTTYGTGATAQANLVASGADLFGYNSPSLNINPASLQFVFSSSEVLATANGFETDNITVSVDEYGQSLNMQYSIPNGGSITDYVVMGNPFHDVYYDDMTPVFITDSELVDTAGAVVVNVDGTNESVTFGDSTTSGSKFIFPFSSTPTTSIVLYIENENGDELAFTVMTQTASSKISLVATSKYTGWVRFIPVPNAYTPSAPTASQRIEGTGLTNGTQTPTTAPTTGFPVTVSGTSPAIMTNQMLNQTWFTAPTVQAIDILPITLYTLTPYTWVNNILLQTMAQNNPATTGTGYSWQGNLQGIFRLSTNGQTLGILLPYLAFDDGTITLSSGTIFDDITTEYFEDLTTNAAGWGGTVPTPPSPIGDTSMSLFTTAFLAGFSNGQAPTIVSTQDGFVTNDYPVYTASTTGTAAVTVFDTYRSAIPTSVSSVSYATDSSGDTMTWEYTTATNAGSGGSSTEPLICFPGWLHLQDVSSLEDAIFPDFIKGNLFTAPTSNGQIVFSESKWPSWIEDGEYLPPGSLTSLFGTNATTVLSWLSDLYENQQLPFPGITPTNDEQWPTQDGFAQPLFQNASGYLQLYGTGKVIFQLAMTANFMAAYLEDQSISKADIVAATQPIIDYVKRVLIDFLIVKPPNVDHYVADGTNQGLCSYGDPLFQVPTANNPVPPYLNTLGFEQQSNEGSGVDFGNPIYNDHILQYGYFLQAAAVVVLWDQNYGTDGEFINQQMLGADGNLYLMRHYIDLIWRDILNPIIDTGGFPFMRGINVWEGHGSAAGTPYIDPTAIVSPTSPGFFLPTGRNLESICENYNSLVGAFYYANAILNDPAVTLSTAQQNLYNTLKDAALVNMKITSRSAKALWYMSGKGYKTSNADPDTTPIYDDYFVNYALTTGNVNDNGITSNVAFTAGPQTGP